MAQGIVSSVDTLRECIMIPDEGLVWTGEASYFIFTLLCEALCRAVEASVLYNTGCQPRPAVTVHMWTPQCGDQSTIELPFLFAASVLQTVARLAGVLFLLLLSIDHMF